MWGFPFPLVLNTKLILMKLILGQSFFVHFLLLICNKQNKEARSVVLCCHLLVGITFTWRTDATAAQTPGDKEIHSLPL